MTSMTSMTSCFKAVYSDWKLTCHTPLGQNMSSIGSIGLSRKPHQSLVATPMLIRVKTPNSAVLILFQSETSETKRQENDTMATNGVFMCFRIQGRSSGSDLLPVLRVFLSRPALASLIGLIRSALMPAWYQHDTECPWSSQHHHHQLLPAIIDRIEII